MPEILPPLHFLSPNIKRYLAEISEQSGRYIVFCSSEINARGMALAWIETDTHMQGAAIYIPISKLNAKSYNPVEHDPIIAHEATHLQLYSQGWAMIEGKDEPSPNEREKIGAIYNWLTDPVINKRIEKRGFSIKANRIQEVQDSIVQLAKGMWSYNLIKNPNGMLASIRLFVSFSLEPNVPPKIKYDFQIAFKNTLPEAYTISHNLLELIKRSGFETPEKFKRTALLCINNLGIDIEKRGVYFKEPWQRFNLEERNKWALDNKVIS